MSYISRLNRKRRGLIEEGRELDEEIRNHPEDRGLVQRRNRIEQEKLSLIRNIEKLRSKALQSETRGVRQEETVSGVINWFMNKVKEIRNKFRLRRTYKIASEPKVSRSLSWYQRRKLNNQAKKKLRAKHIAAQQQIQKEREKGIVSGVPPTHTTEDLGPAREGKWWIWLLILLIFGVISAIFFRVSGIGGSYIPLLVGAFVLLVLLVLLISKARVLRNFFTGNKIVGSIIFGLIVLAILGIGFYFFDLWSLLASGIYGVPVLWLLIPGLILFFAYYILNSGKYPSKKNIFYILLIVGGIALIAYIIYNGLLGIAPGLSLFGVGVNFTLVYLIPALVVLTLLLVGFSYLKNKQAKGWWYILIAILIVILLYSLTYLEGILSLKWIVLIFVGILALVSFIKNKIGYGILLTLVAIVVFFLWTTSGIGFFEGLRASAEVSAGETFSEKLKTYWSYLKDPESFFVRYGEFTNPNVEKRAKVGLEFQSFNPVIPEFRTMQSLRFNAEIKHYTVPLFRDESEEKAKVKLGFFCYIPKDFNSLEEDYIGTIKFTGPGTVKDSDKEGKIIIEGIRKDSNFTMFTRCDFEAGKVKFTGIQKEKETRKAFMNISYEGFITRADVTAYLLDRNTFEQIEKRESSDVEFLNELRNAASFPGLIDNERRSIPEFSSGPVRLRLTILDQQPLYPRDEPYSLVIRTLPNSNDWVGTIVPKNLILEVPGWFEPTGQCDFDPGSGEQRKRLSLKREGQDLLKHCSTSTGCGYFCEFRIRGEAKDHIEEFRISAFQTTDYTVSEGTTFEYIKSRIGDIKEDDEWAKEDPKKFMDQLSESNDIQKLERYLKICENTLDPLNKLSDEVIVKYLQAYCGNAGKIKEIEKKIKSLRDSGVSIEETPEEVNEFEILSSSVETSLSNEEGFYDVKIVVTTNKVSECGNSLSPDNSFDQMSKEFTSADGEIHNLNKKLNLDFPLRTYYIACKEKPGTRITSTEVKFNPPN
ncbi:MAG: hypothetical protein AABW46_00210 [Nanoarchaeota archaeon]